jgi:hypothetical protein
MMTTSTVSLETSVPAFDMTGGGMSSDGMPTMAPAVTSTGIHWRRNRQKSCHHQRSKR